MQWLTAGRKFFWLYAGQAQYCTSKYMNLCVWLFPR